MRNVLIISYYFPPHNGVAGWRPYSWAQHFHKDGIYPTVITRHWNGDENTWQDSMKENKKEVVYKKDQQASLIFLPYTYSFLGKIIFSPLFKVPGFSKIYHLLLFLFGKIAIEVDASHSFKKFLDVYLKEHAFDFMIISSPPHNLVRLGYDIFKKFNIPYAIDFRDSWNNDELKKNYTPGINHKIKNAITKFYMKKWLDNASFIVTVGDSLAKRIHALTHKPVHVIMNGFEHELFDDKNKAPSSSVFTISIIGTIYPKQDLSILLKGLNRFISVAGKEQVLLNFVGIESIETVANMIKNSLPSESVYTSPRLPRSTAIDYTLTSHVLLYAGWKNYEGIFSGKIFDYLGAKRNILIAPGDDDVIDELLHQTNSGKTANSPDEFFNILFNWYTEWKQQGKLSYTGMEEQISMYTREKQAALFAKYINHTIDNTY